MTFKLNRLIAVAVCALAANAGFGADLSRPGPTPAVTEKLADARALISEKKWAAAIDELKRVGDSGNADWNNLMGYSHRKAATPDLAAAERYYGEALLIDPKHRGALEYSGELFLQLGDLVRAEQRLATLDKVCFLPCEEFTELKKAIASFKANGNKVAVTN